MKKLLTVAGSDCSGGAGVQADLKTFAAHGAYGMSVVTAVVAENTERVLAVCPLGADIVERQLHAVFRDIPPDGVKIGMLPRADVMRVVAQALSAYAPPFAVVDPVMAATAGGALMDADARETFVGAVLPLSSLLTPNIPEAEALAGMRIAGADDMRAAARRIRALGPRAVLVKGGHLDGDPMDILFDGADFTVFPGKRIDSRCTHGTGCTLSSAAAANLAQGLALPDAVGAAKRYVAAAIRHAEPIGHGHGPVNHFYAFFGEPAGSPKEGDGI